MMMQAFVAEFSANANYFAVKLNFSLNILFQKF